VVTRSPPCTDSSGFGPIAIVQASKAERLGKVATAAKVLGGIDAIFGAIDIIVFIMMIGGVFAVGGASY
jgi:uncharacterized ion transporter superfamily protein YfcC